MSLSHFILGCITGVVGDRMLGEPLGKATGKVLEKTVGGDLSDMAIVKNIGDKVNRAKDYLVEKGKAVKAKREEKKNRNVVELAVPASLNFSKEEIEDLFAEAVAKKECQEAESKGFGSIVIIGDKKLEDN